MLHFICRTSASAHDPGRRVAPSMRQQTVERHYTRHPRAPNGTGEGTWCPPVIEAESGGAMTATDYGRAAGKPVQTRNMPPRKRHIWNNSQDTSSRAKAGQGRNTPTIMARGGGYGCTADR